MIPPDSIPHADLLGRDDIKVLVDYFYEKVREDLLLSFIFDDIAEFDWGPHLPKMYDFWKTTLFQSGSYHENPLRPHLGLS
jgi:hemoglobin